MEGTPWCCWTWQRSEIEFRIGRGRKLYSAIHRRKAHNPSNVGPPPPPRPRPSTNPFICQMMKINVHWTSWIPCECCITLFSWENINFLGISEKFYFYSNGSCPPVHTSDHLIRVCFWSFDTVGMAAGVSGFPERERLWYMIHLQVNDTHTGDIDTSIRSTSCRHQGVGWSVP